MYIHLVAVMFFFVYFIYITKFPYTDYINTIYVYQIEVQIVNQK